MMDLMAKHLANKCLVRFPNKKAKVATSSGVVREFEIVTAPSAARAKVPDDNNNDSSDKEDNGNFDYVKDNNDRSNRKTAT